MFVKKIWGYVHFNRADQELHFLVWLNLFIYLFNQTCVVRRAEELFMFSIFLGLTTCLCSS